MTNYYQENDDETCKDCCIYCKESHCYCNKIICNELIFDNRFCAITMLSILALVFLIVTKLILLAYVFLLLTYIIGLPMKILFAVFELSNETFNKLYWPTFIIGSIIIISVSMSYFSFSIKDVYDAWITSFA